MRPTLVLTVGLPGSGKTTLAKRLADERRILRWELEHQPLPAPWALDRLIGALTGRPSALFTDLERVARAHGYGDVFDAWGDLDLSR